MADAACDGGWLDAVSGSTEANGASSSSSSSGGGNYYRELLSSIHKPEDLSFIFEGMVGGHLPLSHTDTLHASSCLLPCSPWVSLGGTGHDLLSVCLSVCPCRCAC